MPLKAITSISLGGDASGSWGDMAWKRKAANTQSSETMVDWNNPASDSVDNDLAGWWDQGPAASKKEPVQEAPAAEEAPPPAPVGFTIPKLGKPSPPPKAAPEEPELHDSWTAEPQSLSISGSSGSVSDAGESGGQGLTLSAGNWAAPVVEEPMDSSWTAPPSEPKAEPKPAMMNTGTESEHTIAVPGLAYEAPESEPLPPGAPQIGFDSLPENLPIAPLPSAPEPEPSQETPAQESGPPKVGFPWALVAMFLFLGLAGYGGYLYMEGQKTVSASPTPTSTRFAIKEDSQTWLDSATASVEAKDFPLAVKQLERAVELLISEEAETDKLKSARLSLAAAYFKTHQHEEYRELWLTIGKQHNELAGKAKKRVAQASRQLRIQGHEKVKKAESLLKTRPKQSINLCTEAIELYTKFGGQNGRIARAHGVIGDAYRNLRRNRLAISHYKQAHGLDSGGRYQAEIRKIGTVRRRPKPNRKKPTKLARPPSFVPKTNVPQGY